jgi:enhanced disease susceptibility 1 protein
VTKLESDAHGWLTYGSLGKHVLLSCSFFVVWWKTLPEQHKLASCILKLISVAVPEVNGADGHIWRG